MSGAGWVTSVELRQTVGISHEVACSNVLDVAQKLMREGWNVTLRPTLPDHALSSPEDTRRFMEDGEGSDAD